MHTYKMHKPSRLYQKYHLIFESGFIAESQIVSLRSLLNGRSKTSLSLDEMIELRSLFKYPSKRHYRLQKSQEEKGYRYLYNLAYTPTGKLRKNNPFDQTQLSMLPRDAFCCFFFMGFDFWGDVYQGSIAYAVYRYCDYYGRSFDYLLDNSRSIVIINRNEKVEGI